MLVRAMSLTAKTCDNTEPTAKACKFADGGGLYLEAMPTGAKYWRRKYRFMGKEKRLALCTILVTCLLGGCATPIPLNTLRYEQQTAVTSTKDATVVVVSGAVSGGSSSYLMPVGTIFIPMYTRPSPEAMFNSDDQQAFGEALRTELVRLGVLKTASTDTSATTDLKIQVIFAQTYHNPGIHEYTLDVVAELTGGREPLLRQYHIVSTEKDSIWEKMNTNGYQGKVKAARLLMEKLIPDIERYVASM